MKIEYPRGRVSQKLKNHVPPSHRHTHIRTHPQTYIHLHNSLQRRSTAISNLPERLQITIRMNPIKDIFGIR